MVSDDGAFNGEYVQELGDGDDLVGFLSDLDLTEYQALARGKSRNHTLASTG